MTEFGVLERQTDLGGETLGVASLALEHGVAVFAGDFGKSAAIGGNQRRASAHCFDCRKAETLVEARHHGQFGLGVQLDDALVADAADEVDIRAQTETLDEIVAVAFAWLTDDGERDVALGAQLGHRLEQVRQALERNVGRRCGDESARDAGNVWQWLEQVGVYAHRHETHAIEADAHVGVDVFDAVLADDHNARHATGDAALHLHEAVPAAHTATLPT